MEKGREEAERESRRGKKGVGKERVKELSKKK